VIYVAMGMTTLSVYEHDLEKRFLHATQVTLRLALRLVSSFFFDETVLLV